MLNRADVDRLVSRVSDRDSLWDNAKLDVAAVARRARVEHAVETLLELGHGQLGGELLRLEHERQQPVRSTPGYTSAA